VNSLTLVQINEFKRETSIMSSLSCPYILSIFGIVIKSMAMVIEYAPYGTLGDYIYSRKPFPTAKRIKYSLDISHGLHYLQNCSVPIMHRDIRSYNMFIFSHNPEEDVCVKIGDFGLAVRSHMPIDEPMATWQWLAPEVFDGQMYDERSDIYSLGMVFYEIFARCQPFTERTEYIITTVKILNEEEMKQINFLASQGYVIDGNKATLETFQTQSIKTDIISNNLRPTIPTSWNIEIIGLITQCWDRDPKQRPNTETIVKFFSNIKTYLSNENASEHEKPYQEPKSWVRTNERISKGKSQLLKIESFKHLKTSDEIFEKFIATGNNVDSG